LASRKGRITLVVQWLLAAVVIGFAARELARQWQGIAPALAGVRLDWGRIAASGALVLATYLLLIEAWRSTLRAWSQTLPFGESARIWFVSNLGKYVPGRVWQIAAMGAMAQRAGVSPTAAIGSSLVVNLVSVIAGFAVIAMTAGERIADVVGLDAAAAGSESARLTVIGIAVVGAVALAAAPYVIPKVVALAARLTGRTFVVPQIPLRAIWIATATTVASWVLYGVAFAWFARGVSPRVTGNAWSYIAVYTGSYLAGYLALFAPGGVGVREAALVLAMPRFQLATAADAVVIAITSRLWLTVLEILPGLLLLRQRGGVERRIADNTDDG